MNPDKSILFVGAGRIGGALIKGLTKGGFDPSSLYAADLDQAVLDDIRDRYEVNVLTKAVDILPRVDIVVIAVKPQHVRSVLKELRDKITSEHLIISIVAGYSTKVIEQLLHEGARVIRVMPNTAASVCASISVISPGKNVSKEDIDLTCRIFESVGKTTIVDEGLQSAVTALSGSGPAYFYLMVEALAEAGAAAGMEKDVALNLAHETMFGASRVLKMTGKEPSDLIEMVKSPGGTTAAAFEVFEADGFKHIIADAFKAALLRAQLLETEE